MIDDGYLVGKFDVEEYLLFGKLCGLWEFNVYCVVFDVIFLLFFM